MSYESQPRFRLKFFRMSLRARVTLGVALPILLVLVSLSLMRYQRERRLLEDQMRLTVMQLGEVMVGSLHHAMLTNDPEMLAQVLSDVGNMDTVQRVQIVNLTGEVKADSRGEQVGKVWQLDDPGCIECHQSTTESPPRTVWFSASDDVLRISTPISNEPDCIGCHAQDTSHLGVLLADVSVVDIEEHLRNNLRLDLTISLGSTVLVTLGLYLLVHWLVVQRVEAFRHPLAKFAAGDFSTRLPVTPSSTDELGELVDVFNRMADERERHVHEQEERDKLRQRAIAEERERIARELHDGLAQLLGYVNTKAMAVRLMLKNHQLEAADQNLYQLEEASRELFVDVREAIVDLKTAEDDGANLAITLKDYIAQFSRLSGLPVELALAPKIANLSLTADTDLQLLRIVQESLTNVRKHASASSIGVSLQIDDGILELTVSDDGLGFTPDDVLSNHQPHFGLSTMRERAEAIGAEFHLNSEPQAGTCVAVRLAVKNLSRAEPKEN
ncbi:MAG: HAMP domain-containing protein [Chloroflexi bacterium]|nr:HAMP domain-containing protein [Chloroflexota bacterium]